MLKSKSLCFILIVTLFTSFVPVKAQEGTYNVSFYDYCEGLSDNDKAVSVGVFFSSIGMWVGGFETDTELGRFASYVISDMNAIVYKGSSIWEKLVAQGMTENKLIEVIRNYAPMRPIVRELYSISNILDEEKIKKLFSDMGIDIRVYPENPNFTGRKVALALILFKNFDIPVLKYAEKFFINSENIETFEITKELFVKDTAINVSFSVLADNLKKELNKLSKNIINKELRVLIDFKIVELGGPIFTPTTFPDLTPGPTHTPNPTINPNPETKHEAILSKIKKISSKKRITRGNIKAFIREVNKLKKESLKWLGYSQQLGEKSIESCNKTLIYSRRLLKKTSQKNKLKILKSIGGLIEYQRQVLTESLQVESYTENLLKTVDLSGKCLKGIKTSTKKAKKVVSSFRKILGILASDQVKQLSRNVFDAEDGENEYLLTIDENRLVRLQPGISQGKLASQQFRKKFNKAKISLKQLKKYFDPKKKYSLIYVNQIPQGQNCKIIINKKVSKKLIKSKVYVIIETKELLVHMPYKSLKKGKKGQVNFEVNKKNGKIIVSFGFRNIRKKGINVAVKYSKIGNGKKPKESTLYLNSKKQRIKASQDRVMKYMSWAM